MCVCVYVCVCVCVFHYFNYYLPDFVTATYLGLIFGLLPWWLSAKESKCNAAAAGDLGLITGSERSSGEGNGNPLQYSCLENPMDGRVW